MIRSAVPVLLVLTPALCAAPPAPSIPETPARPVVDSYHGVEVVDSYRWLEEESSETSDWMRAQDVATRAELEPLAERAAILERLRAIRPEAVLSLPHFRGPRTFFQRSRRDDDGALRQQIVVVEQDIERVLADLEDFPGASRFATTTGSGAPTFDPSPDGRRLAFGVVYGTSLWTRWRVVDVADGTLLDEVVEGIATVAATVAWAADGAGFYYGAFDDAGRSENVEDLRHHSIRFHRIGDDGGDALIHRDQDPSRTFALTVLADGSSLALVVASGGEPDVLFVDLDDAGAAREVASGDGASHGVVGRIGDELLLLSTDGDTSGGRVVAVDLATGARRVVVPEPAFGSLVSARLIGGRLVVHGVEHATPRLTLHDLEGAGDPIDVELPYVGWLRGGVLGRPGDPRAAFYLQGTADPGTVYVLDTASGATVPFHTSSGTFDAARYVTRRVFYPARDGTLIPLFLMHRPGIALDGTHPVWLYAYGARWSAAPWYQPQHRLWLELGGIYALAHVRGGGEYGRAWVEAGSGLAKQTGIDDYLAAAEWLIGHGYTSRERLLANGGSASGPLVSAAVNQRPDLFRVALISYPLLDLMRAPVFGSTLLSSFDAPDTPAKAAALASWSPYHNVREGACYPAVLIAHGDQDRIAPPLHSYKLVAALQHAQGCARPIRLQLAWGRGHTVGGLEERANQLAFAARELAMSVPAPWAEQR